MPVKIGHFSFNFSKKILETIIKNLRFNIAANLSDRRPFENQEFSSIGHFL